MNIRQAINATRTRLAPLTRLALGIPAQAWLAAAALIFVGLWLQEHDASVRRGAQLQQLEKQSAAEVSELEARADAARRAANESNARVVEGLEAQRRNLAARADELGAQLRALKQQEQARAEEIAALSPSEIVKRLSVELGPGSVAPAATATPGTEAPAGTLPEDAGDVKSPLQLTDAGARQVALALAERDACRDQSALQDRLLRNCREQLAAGAAEVERQADSLSKLNQALEAKDRILAQREAAFRAELKAARGTWRSRLVRTLEHVAVGVAIGAAIR